MKSRKLQLLIITNFLFVTSFCYSQVLTPRPTSISGTCGGYYEYLPQGYSTNTSQNFPLIVAVHGIGEIGNGTTDLGNLLNCWTAIPRLIANGGFPVSVSVGGQSFSFIVIAPQFNQWPYASDVNAVVDYAVSHYRVDQSRIYVTGLSMGGGSVWDFAGNYPTKAAAVVPVCGAASPDNTRAQAIANAKLPVWATHNQYDPTVSVSNTTGWVSLISQFGGDIQSTIFPVSGHDAWSKTYDPNFTQNGVNVYQWMLMHQKGSTTPPPPPPTTTNQSPSANAGANQTITLPTSSVTLSGTGSDPDGTINFYQWNQASGPSTATIASPYSASTAVSGLVQGTYVFTLKVTDNLGATATSNVTITVNASVNQPPTANAGPNQTITLPQSSVTLAGSGTDPDGAISFYQWGQASGPSTATFSNLYTATPAVTGLVQGSYVFTLKVTDNQGATATSNVTITVNAAANQPPVANAGANQTITLPQSSATLSGSGTDADGTISSYQWTEASGPSQAAIASASAASTQVSNLVQGSYVFTLKVTDNQGATATSNVTVTVNAAANQPPVANAGANQTITLPQSSATLSGSGTDADGTISTYQWTEASGPSPATIASASAASTQVSNLVQGSYVFTLKVTDNQGATATSNVTITVNAPANQPPVANAGANQTITLPQSSATLSGSGTDADGTISTYEWTEASGPSQAAIASASATSTQVSNLVQGSYVFTLKVTDNQGATATSNVTITVNAPANQPPVANAGANQTITLPQSSTILVGSGSDADGTVSGYQWSQVSGPSQLTFNNAASAMCTISNFKKGVYVLRLTVKDNQGATAWSEMTLTVLAPPNQPPTADAGPNQTITLPVNSVNLLGTASDADGTVVSYNWTQTSGPTKTSFSSASPLALTVNNLEEGIYVFRLTVTDNDGATTWDEVKVNVMPDPRTVSTAAVYPNPATNLINVKIEALTFQNNSILRITNSAGTVVYTESFQRTGFTMIKQVDITKLPSGIYFLSVTSDINTITTVKFAKQ